MTSSRYSAILGLAAVLALVPASMAQRSFSIGYVYPAGAQQGTTTEHVIGGQFLFGLTNVFVSGGGVKVSLGDYIHPIQGRELNNLRIQLDELMERRAAALKDRRSLEYLKSFKLGKKNAKNGKPDDKAVTIMSDEELKEEVAKKYPNAKWTPEDEKLINEIRRRISSGVRKPANPAISELAVVQITVDPNAEPGQRELRLASVTGLSNPLVFWVGQQPEYSEEASKAIAQQKSAIDKTAFRNTRGQRSRIDKVVSVPTVINGQILPGEADRHKFKATKGQKLVISVAARQLIPYISDAVPGWFQATLALYDPNGKEVAYDDDFRFNPDPVIYYEVPADGEYALEIKDAIYRGREDFVYRITISETPFVTSIFPLGGPAGSSTSVAMKGWNLPGKTFTFDAKDKQPGVCSFTVEKDKQVSNPVLFAVDTLPECLEKEPNNNEAHAQHVTLPIIINGRIDKRDDTDVFRFEGSEGQEIVTEVMARRLNSPLDSIVKLTDASGKQIAVNDDHTDKGFGLTTHHADSYLTAKLPKSGAYYVHISDTQHNGGDEFAYRLRISSPQPDFALRVVPSSIGARAGAFVPVTVYALRKDGFTGEINVDLKNALPGFRLAGAKIPAKEDKLKLTLGMPFAHQEEPVSLKIEGTATIDGREVAHTAVPSQDMMQAFEYRHLVPSQDMKVAVVGRFTPKGAGSGLKILTDMPVNIPAGGIAKVRISTPPGVNPSKARLELSEAPDGIAIKNVAMSSSGMEIELESDVAKVKPGQKGNLIVSAFPAKQMPAKAKSKKGQSKGMTPIAMLPAISFEITQK